MNEADNAGRLAAGAADSAAPGARLSQARQAQNLATADVARRLKLSVWQIEALEADRYHDLPGPIFVRGFIRNYAKLVKLDPEELLHAAAGSLPQTALRPEMPPSQDIPFPSATARPWPRYAAGAAVIVGLLAVYEFFFNDAPQTVATRPAADAPAPKPRKPGTTASSSSPQSTGTARAGQPAATPAAIAPIARHAPDASPAGATQLQERAVNPQEREVRFVFDEESWVEIRDRNDKVIFYQLNASGTARRVSGLPPLTVVVGNAHGVRMTYAGQPIDLARHTRIDVARLTLE